MTLPSPTVQKTWEYLDPVFIQPDTTLISNATTDRVLLMLAIKNALVSTEFTTPWVVERSCDGVTVSATDLWADKSKLVWTASASGTVGTARSWIVLYNSGYGLRLLLDLAQAATGGLGGQIDAYLSTAVYSGGSTTALPTTAGNVARLSDRTVSTKRLWEGTSASISVKTRFGLNVMMSSDGQETRVFISNDNLVTGTWVLGRLQTYTSGYTWPQYACITNKTAGVSATIAENVLGHTGFMGFTNAGASVTLLPFVPAGCRYRQSTSSSVVDTYEQGIGQKISSFSGVYALSTVALGSTTAGWQGVHGLIKDTWLGPSAEQRSTLYPRYSKLFAQFGGLVVPWTGTTVKL